MKRRISGDVLGWLPGSGGFVFTPKPDGSTPTTPVDTVYPVAVDDVASTTSDQSITVAVLSNDTHADNETLRIKTAYVNSNHGGVVINPNNTLTFTPVGTFVGIAQVSYVVEDQSDHTDTGVLSVTVNPPANVTPPGSVPVTVGDTTTTQKNTSVSVDVVANDTHPDGDLLRLVRVSMDASAGTAVVTNNTTITYIPAVDFVGAATITYTVTDYDGDEVDGVLVVTVEDESDVVTPPPVTSDGPNLTNDAATTEPNQLVVVSVLANDTHPQSETMTVTEAVCSASEGTVQISGAGTTVTFIPATDWIGVATVSYTVTDESGLTSTGYIAITVAYPDVDGPAPEIPTDPPENITGASIPTGTFYIGYPMEITNDTWDNNPDTFQYSWFRGGVEISDEDSEPSSGERIYFPNYQDHGAVLNAEVTASNVVGAAPTITTNTTIQTGAYKTSGIRPVFTPTVAREVVIEGGEPAAINRKLAAKPAQWDEIPDSTTREWLRDGVAIPGETGLKYTPVAADVGTVLTFKETATYLDPALTLTSQVQTGVVLGHQIMEWGDKTPATFGEYILKDLTGTPLTNVTVAAGTTLAQAAYTLIGNVVTPAADASFMGTDGQLLVVNSDQGEVTFQVLELADAMSFKPEWPAHTWYLDERQNRIYDWRSQLMRILNVDPGSPEDEALNGLTLYGRHGTQGIHEDGFNVYPNVRAWDKQLTIQSHDMPTRPEVGEDTLILKAHGGNVSWGAVAKHRFYRLRWISQWDKNLYEFWDDTNTVPVNSKGGNIILSGDFGWLTWEQCEIDGEYRKHVANYGEPYYANDYTYNGFIYCQNGATPLGPITIKECDIHDYHRAISVTLTVPGLIFEDNDFHHCAMDTFVLSAGNANPKMPTEHDGYRWTRNRWYTQVNHKPPEMNVVAFDWQNSTVDIEDPDQALLGNPTMNWAEGSTTLPDGYETWTDMVSTTVSHTNGVTRLHLVYSTFTDAGAGLKIRLEPAHADYFQGIMDPYREVRGIQIYNNSIFGYPDVGQDVNAYHWPQGFFFEDISNAAKDNYYHETVISGNFLYTAQTVHGISLYNAKDSAICDNTCVVPERSVVSTGYVSQIGIRKHWQTIGSGNLMSGNFADRIVSYITQEDHPNAEKETVIWKDKFQNVRVAPENYAASDLLALTNGRNPTKFEDAVKSFRRKDMTGVVDYLTRYADLPSINDCDMPVFTPELFADTAQMVVHAPVLINSIKDSAGNPSRYGIMADVDEGFETKIRTTSDLAGINVIQDWTDEPFIIKNGEYLWVRTLASGNPNVETNPRVRLGRNQSKWTVFSYGLDKWKPTLTNVDVYNRSATDATLGFTTDEDNGKAYWFVDQVATHTAEWLKLNGAFVRVEFSGEQPSGIKIQTLDPGTTYYAHLCHEDNAGNVSDVTSFAFTTTGDVIYSEEFTTDTTTTFSGYSGTLDHDAELEAAEYKSGTASWDGFAPTAGIFLPHAGTFFIEAIISNEDSLGQVDMVVGDSVSVITGKSSNILYSDVMQVAKVEYKTLGPETVFPKVRFRGTGEGRIFLLFSIRVTEDAEYHPILNNSVFGNVFDNPVPDIAYFNDMHTNPADSGFVYYPETNLTWKQYQTELTYEVTQGFDYFNTPEVKLMPNTEYTYEAIVEMKSPTGSVQGSVGRQAFIGDIGESPVRYAQGDGISLISMDFTTTPRRKIAASTYVRAGDTTGQQVTIYGIRIAKKSLNLNPLTLADVSTQAIDPPATVNPVNVFVEDATTDNRASLILTDSAGSLHYFGDDPRYEYQQSIEQWEGVASPLINVVNDGTRTYRATAVLENRHNTGAADLVLVRDNDVEVATSEIRTGTRNRAQMTVQINPDDAQLSVKGRRRGGALNNVTGIAYLRLDEINHSVLNWTLWDKVFPAVGQDAETWSCHLRTGYDWNTYWGEERIYNSGNMNGKTRAEMLTELKTWLDTMVGVGFLEAATLSGDGIIIAGSPLKGPLLEPRFSYNYKLTYDENYDPTDPLTWP